MPGFSFYKKYRHYIFSIVGLYLSFLLATLPANLIVSVINLPNSITYSSVSGSVWSGQLKQFGVAGLNLGSVKWRLHPFNLLLGEIFADVSIANDNQYLKTNMTLSVAGEIELDNTRFFIDSAMLQPLIYGMPFSFSGSASGNFSYISFFKNNHVAINGQLSLNELIFISPQQQNLGDFVIDFTADKNGGTYAAVKDTTEHESPLNLSGEMKLAKNGELNLSAKLSVMDKDSSLDNMIAFLGKKDSQGWVQIDNHFMLWH
jgi:general secretion pathway protein N